MRGRDVTRKAFVVRERGVRVAQRGVKRGEGERECAERVWACVTWRTFRPTREALASDQIRRLERL